MDSKTDEKLSEAEFTIYTDLNQNGKLDSEEQNVDNVIQVKKTDDKGYVKFEYLDLGEYILKETAAPDGYELNDNNEHAFKIEENNQNIKYKVKNNKIKEVTYLVTGMVLNKAILQVFSLVTLMLSLVIVVSKR